MKPGTVLEHPLHGLITVLGKSQTIVNAIHWKLIEPDDLEGHTPVEIVEKWRVHAE